MDVLVFALRTEAGSDAHTSQARLDPPLKVNRARRGLRRGVGNAAAVPRFVARDVGRIGEHEIDAAGPEAAAAMVTADAETAATRKSRPPEGSAWRKGAGRYLALYVRAPDSLLDDSIFVVLPIVAMAPRTLCFCQPVASMISSSVAPFFREIRARIVSFLLVPAAFGVFAGLAVFVPLPGFGALALRAALRSAGGASVAAVSASGPGGLKNRSGPDAIGEKWRGWSFL
jgi:hypothetical protein